MHDEHLSKYLRSSICNGVDIGTELRRSFLKVIEFISPQAVVDAVHSRVHGL